MSVIARARALLLLVVATVSLAGASLPATSALAAKRDSTTTLSAPSVATPDSDEQITVSVARGRGDAAGKVRLFINGERVASLTLRNGKATYRMYIHEGANRIRAEYLGNATTLASQQKTTVMGRN